MSVSEQWRAVDQFFSDALLPADSVMDTVLRRCQDADLPQINVAPVQGKMLHLLARMVGARRILEIGTLGGYSAIWLARALPDDGQLVTLELNPDFAELARRNLETAGQHHKTTVMQGAALDSLQSLVDAGADAFDFVFIDADKENNANYLALILKLARPGTVIICDNVVRGGTLTDPQSSEDPNVQGVRRYFHDVAQLPDASSTAIQTVGLKGWDGFAITIV